jgi:glycosyltransferase involved in cell wall biosynthesis
VTSEVCWHSVDVDAFEDADVRTLGPPVIAVLGTVYVVNSAEFGRLCQAISRIRSESHPDVTLRLYTQQSIDQLDSQGIPRHPWLRVDSLDQDEIPEALAAARILFLGLSFDPRWRRVGQVAFPTKLAEYLAAGRPIIVNAPMEATAATYVRETGAGLVVTEPDDLALASAITRILEDDELALELGRRGRVTARLNHDRAKVVRRFHDRLRSARYRRGWSSRDAVVGP